MSQSFPRTDLAWETHELWRRGEKRSVPGLIVRTETAEGFEKQVLEISSEEASKELCKPQGRYVTFSLGSLLRREADAFDRGCAALAGELRRQLALKGGESVLAVCLGNPDVTPDAVGPLAADSILATRHLKEAMPGDFGDFRSVTVLRTGVLGTTGLESAALAAAAVRAVGADRVVAVDALAACGTERLCRSVQISDAGIVPGSGVGNSRSALNAETLGVPVVAVGVPTVVDAATLCADLAGAPAPGGQELFVTPRDIDARVREIARLVGCAVDLALHDGLTMEDLRLLLP